MTRGLKNYFFIIKPIPKIKSLSTGRNMSLYTNFSADRNILNLLKACLTEVCERLP